MGKDIRINKNGNWVDLTELPRKNGKCNKIDWANSVGYFVKFKYEDIEGEIEIVDYNKDNRHLEVKYKGNIYYIEDYGLTKCRIDKLFVKDKYCIKRYYGDNYIDLTNLYTNNLGIDWDKSIGINIGFKYENIIGHFNIEEYIRDKQNVVIKYNNNKFLIKTSDILKCYLGRIVGLRTSDFKIKIGQTFKDNKRDITITDREYIKDRKGRIWKGYKYKCNKCGFDCGEHYKNGEYSNKHWTEEGNLLKGSGCACCSNSIITVEGINDIPTTAPWMVKYFQGGYDEAKKYSKGSNQNIYPICPDCNTIKKSKMIINNIYKRHSIGCDKCGDGLSYPEKFVYSVLKQLGVEFETQYSPEWADNKKYDFYFELNNKKYIIETHGRQHYENGFKNIGGRTLKEEQNNDIYKEKIALKNGIKKYIQLDCKESNIEYIKNSILNSEINNIFNLNSIDWSKCEEFAVGNLCREVCEYRAIHKNMSANDIGNLFNIGRQTIRKYLKIGDNLKWCSYNADDEMIKNAYKNGGMNKKTVEIFKDDISLGVFESCHELERQSEKLFDIRLGSDAISKVANNKKPQYKGFTFKYIDKEDCLEKIS